MTGVDSGTFLLAIQFSDLDKFGDMYMDMMELCPPMNIARSFVQQVQGFGWAGLYATKDFVRGRINLIFQDSDAGHDDWEQ